MIQRPASALLPSPDLSFRRAGAHFSPAASMALTGWIWLGCALLGNMIGDRLLRPFFQMPIERITDPGVLTTAVSSAQVGTPKVDLSGRRSASSFAALFCGSHAVSSAGGCQ